MGDFNVTGNLSNAIKGIKSYNGEELEDFSVWHKRKGFILSTQRPGICPVMEGQSRPTDDTADIPPSPLFTSGWLDATTGGTLEQRQAAIDSANQDLNAIIFLSTDKAAALLVATHAYDARETRGDGQKAIKEREDKYLRFADESIGALQAALAATTMDPDDDPNHYIMKATQLRSKPTAAKEPITEWRFHNIIVQGPPEKYRDIKLGTYKDPDFDLLKIQATMHHLYLDDLSRSKGKSGLIAGRGVAMLVESGLDPNSNICHNCGKPGHYKSGCAVPCKNNDKRGNDHPGKCRKSGGEAVGTAKKWYSALNSTSHNDADGYKHGDLRPKDCGVCNATVPGARSHPTENSQKLAINVNDDFDGGFQFYKRMSTRSKQNASLGSLDQLHC